MSEMGNRDVRKIPPKLPKFLEGSRDAMLLKTDATMIHLRYRFTSFAEKTDQPTATNVPWCSLLYHFFRRNAKKEDASVDAFPFSRFLCSL